LNCRTLQSLSPSEAGACRDFILATHEQMLRLNHPLKPTPFAISSEPLYVKEGGKPRPVAAMIGEKGEIIFHYGKVSELFPSELLFLMGHEFGHKVEWPGPGSSVTDVDAYPPFETGRRFLDTVGAALAVFAARHGKIGKYFGLDDRFSCAIRDLDSGRVFSSNGSTARLFQSGFDAYETGVGTLPRDFRCTMAGIKAGTSVWLSVKIHEQDGCRPTSVDRRWTRLEIIRRYDDILKPGVPDETLESRLLPGVNPLCEGKLPSAPLGLEFPSEHLGFQVRYEGSVGKTR
jgi:hypothetical protein